MLNYELGFYTRVFACCLLMCTRITYAAGDDTDGTELQVAQPVVLQIQLGQQWAGTEFQLKTNAGLYPGTITVGQDGILRTELGSSGTYILSCVNSGVTVLSVLPQPTPAAEQAGNEPGVIRSVGIQGPGSIGLRGVAS